MHISRRAGHLALCTSVLVLAACTSASDESPLASASPGVYGTALDDSAPEPTEVARDAPPTIGATDDATVQITYFGWNPDLSAVELGGFAASVVETDGTCTLTLTKDGATATSSSAATPNVGTTACGEQLVPGDQLSRGTWTAVLTYDSPTSHGESAPVEVEVP
jgi:hypothetical protein